MSPTTYTSDMDNTISKIVVRGYNNFDPFDGVSITVSLFNSSEQLITNKIIKITGDDWQNWPPSTTREQDEAYVQSGILTSLGLTAV